ncbi:MAG TPA: PHB depolymerase family esterase [Pyrinomonadaceae bacterium]
MYRRPAILFIALLTVLCAASPLSAQAGRWETGSASDSSGSSRAYKLWVPSGYNNSKPVPLVLMLHGCTQTPADFAAGTQMNALADKHNFMVVYPAQPAEANPVKCWNWFQPEHQQRGAGEPALLAAVVSRVRATYKVDDRRIYVVGISAGGAMAVIMGVAYPDIFSAVGVSAALQYKAASNVGEALAAQSAGSRQDPNAQGTLAYRAMHDIKPAPRKRRIPLIVFQGSLDVAVAPANAAQIITQWAQMNDYLDDDADNNTVDDKAESTTPGAVPNGHSYERSVYKDKSGRVLLEKWMVEGMRHAWPGGSSAGTYTDPKGPNASAEMWRFFTETR